MNEPPLNRWNTGIAIRRWRMPLITVLLIPVAIGVSLEGLAYLRAQEAKCVIQYRAGPAMTMEGMQELILSDAFLEEARHLASSPFSQGVVKKLVRCEPINGTSLLIISAKGWNTPDKVKLCTVLSELVQTHAIARIDESILRPLEEKESAVRTLEAEVEAKREKLSDLIRLEHPLHRGSPIHHPEREFETASKDLEESRRALESAHLALVAEAMRTRITMEPVIIHEPAGPPRPIAFAEILPCALRLSTWIGSGFMIALILAFLLEAMRRTPQKSVIYE